MATPAHLAPLNLRLSFQKKIQDSVETPNVDPLGRAYQAGFLDYSLAFSDMTDFDQWARVDILESGAGTYGRTIVQITCFSRITSDEYGIELDRMIDLFQAAMRLEAGTIDIYDYAVQASPVLVPGKRIQIVNAAGRFGEPEGGAVDVDPPEDTLGKALTYVYRVMPSDYPSFPYRDSS